MLHSHLCGRRDRIAAMLVAFGGRVPGLVLIALLVDGLHEIRFVRDLMGLHNALRTETETLRQPHHNHTGPVFHSSD